MSIADPCVFETGWTRSVKRGERPCPSSLKDHLLAVHRDHAGFTESCARRCRDDQGRNSYEWLADVVDPAHHRRVLDLACGSGPLLELCWRRFGGAIELTGVDMSADELALARERLPDRAVALYEGMAQDLEVIEEASLDVVLCHWALTLMDPVVPVLEEVRRLLRAGGVFAAIIDGETSLAPGYDAVCEIIFARVQREVPGYGTVDLGDARVRKSSDILSLAREVFPEAQIVIEPSVFRLEATPAILAREAAGFFYASFVLSAEGREGMLKDLEALFAARAEAGQGGYAMPINRLVVRRG